jgi:hypothetical protein
MHNTRARKMVSDLREAGVEFEWRTFWRKTGKAIPGNVDLLALPSTDWDCELVPVFPLLPDAHPRFKFLEAVMDCYSSSAMFRDAIHDAAVGIRAEEQDREFLRMEQQADEAIAASCPRLCD